jgi:hypothetical protein
MKAFNLLSQQDQLEAATVIAQYVLFLVSIWVLLLTALLSAAGNTLSSLRNGFLLIWTLICISSILGDPSHWLRFSFICAGGILLARIVGATMPGLCHRLWIRFRWNKLAKAWVAKTE